MNSSFRSFPIVSLACLALLGTGISAEATTSYHLLNGSPNGTYQLDPQHSQVFFTLGHAGITAFTGRFNEVTGSYTVNVQDPAKDRVAIQIPAKSIDTDFAARDRLLRGPMFFNVKQFPTIRFVSDHYVPDGPQKGTLYGTLTLHGVSRPVAFHVQRLGAGEVHLPKPWGGYLSGFVAETRIHRANYGLTAFLPQGLSNTIRIRVEIEGVRQGK